MADIFIVLGCSRLLKQIQIDAKGMGRFIFNAIRYSKDFNWYVMQGMKVSITCALVSEVSL